MTTETQASTTDRFFTSSGEYMVFHRDSAGSPEQFDDEGGPWYFQPNDPHGGDDVYSAGFPSAAAALTAAEEWEAQQDTSEEIEA